MLGRPRAHRYPLATKVPPSYLTATWTDLGSDAPATWPTNVSDPAMLPPPEELRNLSLEDLLHILSSTGPAYQAIAKLIQRREATRKAADAFETDPHKRIDTRHHLLKRMRRGSLALEELRPPHRTFDLQSGRAVVAVERPAGPTRTRDQARR